VKSKRAAKRKPPDPAGGAAGLAAAPCRDWITLGPAIPATQEEIAIKAITPATQEEGVRLRPTLADLLKTPIGKIVAKRLKDKVASNALAAIVDKSGKRDEIVRACIVAEYLNQARGGIVEAGRARRKQLDKRAKEVEHLTRFLDEAAAPVDPMKDWPLVFRVMPMSENDREVVRKGLTLLSKRLKFEQNNIALRGALLRVTRKTSAETYAIGWTAAEVRRLTGQPHSEKVGVLATHILATEKPVAGTRVQDALRAWESAANPYSPANLARQRTWFIEGSKIVLKKR
jgi:hypothetical protein